MSQGTFVNLGCGHRYHPDWVNIDIAPAGPNVIKHDLRLGIPLQSKCCDLVYHSHILEHIPRAYVRQFMSECYRVLKPGGVIRVVVPDLEQICTLYLEKLRASLSGDPDARADYDWMVIELLDQAVREESGGAMMAYLRNEQVVNADFVYGRIGEEAFRISSHLAQARVVSAPSTDRLRSAHASRLRKICSPIRRPRSLLIRGLLILLAGRDAARAYDVGRFRQRGEVHHWMYDRYSLGALMTSCGFVRTTQRSANESAIPGWTTFHLDVAPSGVVNKPDSLYMEAIRPHAL